LLRREARASQRQKQRGENIISKGKEQNQSAGKLQVFRKLLQSYITQPLVVFLAKTHVTPNMVTVFGFFIIIASSILAAYGHLFAAGWVLLLSGFFDIIDGALARHTNQVTQFGGILDSSLDRLSEGAMLLGIMAYYLSNTSVYQEWIVLMIGATIITSFLVSYVRSRAEAAGLDCQVGIFTRTERVIILALGLLINQLTIILSIIAVLSLATMIQRLIYVYQKAKK
jgi:CDP-diacylglycerol---glycerol-3-phosphate 3-phosphatidyltransferase